MARREDREKAVVGAIDLGTTGVRFALYDRDARVVASAYREIPVETPRPGWVEQDPARMLEATQSVLQDVLARDVSYSARLSAVGLTNQRETVIAWDRETGRPLHPAIVWQDRRTAARCRELSAGEDGETIRSRTGLPIDPYFSATKLEWLLENVSGLRDRAASGGALLGTVDAWLVWQLTGEHVTDDTNASRTMLFDIARRRWDADLLALFGIPSEALPRLQPSLSVLGAVKPERLLGAEVQVSGVLGDQQAALLGQGLTDAREMQVTWGTGAFLLMNTGTRLSRSTSGLIPTIARTAPEASVHYALEGSVFVAGAAIQWLRDELRLFVESAESDAMARSIDSSGGVVFVPALTGLGAPHWDPGARGMIIGLTRSTTREHLARAALEAIAFQTHDVVRAMERDAGEAVEALHVSGGAASNDFLCQFQSDILGVPVVRPKDRETTARGAAYAAGIASGLWEGPSDVRGLHEVDRVFEASISNEARERLLTDWTRAVERAGEWHRE